jgi:hypothetical protein
MEPIISIAPANVIQPRPLRRDLGRSLFGILIAAVNALVHLIAIGGKPIFSLIILAIDALIIYGLAAHGFGQNQR